MFVESVDSERLKTLTDMKDELSREPPDTADSCALTLFYVERAAKAMKLGRTKQAMM